MTIGSASIALSDFDDIVAGVSALTRSVCVAASLTGCDMFTSPVMCFSIASARWFKPSVAEVDFRFIDARGVKPVQLMSS
jgi:hypothetical protein